MTGKLTPMAMAKGIDESKPGVIGSPRKASLRGSPRRQLEVETAKGDELVTTEDDTDSPKKARKGDEKAREQVCLSGKKRKHEEVR